MDSIIQFVEDHPSRIKIITNAFIRFYYTGKKDLAQTLIEKAKNSDRIQSNKSYQTNYYTDQGYFYLWENNLDSCWQYIKILNTITSQENTQILRTTQLTGNYYYLTNQIDSAKLYYNRGFQRSKESGHNTFLDDFANNLGAIAFDAKMFGTASYYFSLAYRINKKGKGKNLMLINNLAACYLNENKPQQALRLLLPLKNSLTSENNNYEKNLIKINYITALLSTHNIKLANEIIQKINWDKIPQSLKGDFFVTKLRYLESTDFTNATLFLKKEKENFAKYRVQILKDFGIGFVQLYQKYPEAYNYLNIKNTPKEFERFDAKTKHHFHKIRSLEFERNGMMKQALYELRNAYEYLREYNSITDSLKIADTRANIALVELEDQLNQSTKELNYSKQINEQNRISIILLALLIIILISFGYFIYQNRTNKIRLAQLEIDSKSREASFLEEEKLLNSRIASLSKIIIIKSKELAQKIKDGPYSNEPEIYNVQKELEQLSLINATVNVSSEIEILNQDHGYLKKSDFTNLNDTKKRVLILSVEQYKPKEIAATLGLSYAYVRNVQVQLRKLIQQNGFSSFQELKLL
ncbi:MAG: hypothetical protein ACPGCV_07510 [Bacteroidia bacterium]